MRVKNTYSILPMFVFEFRRERDQFVHVDVYRLHPYSRRYMYTARISPTDAIRNLRLIPVNTVRCIVIRTQPDSPERAAESASAYRSLSDTHVRYENCDIDMFNYGNLGNRFVPSRSASPPPFRGAQEHVVAGPSHLNIPPRGGQEACGDYIRTEHEQQRYQQYLNRRFEPQQQHQQHDQQIPSSSNESRYEVLDANGSSRPRDQSEIYDELWYLEDNTTQSSYQDSVSSSSSNTDTLAEESVSNLYAALMREAHGVDSNHVFERLIERHLGPNRNQIQDATTSTSDDRNFAVGNIHPNRDVGQGVVAGYDITTDEHTQPIRICVSDTEVVRGRKRKRLTDDDDDDDGDDDEFSGDIKKSRSMKELNTRNEDKKRRNVDRMIRNNVIRSC